MNKQKPREISIAHPSLLECVNSALMSDEYVENWSRLRGIRLQRSLIDCMIDEATGYEEHVAAVFINDVYDLIYSRVKPHVEQNPVSSER